MFEQVRGRETWGWRLFGVTRLYNARARAYYTRTRETKTRLSSGEHVSWWGHQRELTYWVDSYDTHTCASLSLPSIPAFFSPPPPPLLCPIVCGSSLHFVSSSPFEGFFPSRRFCFWSCIEKARLYRKDGVVKYLVSFFLRFYFCISSSRLSLFKNLFSGKLAISNDYRSNLTIAHTSSSDLISVKWNHSISNKLCKFVRMPVIRI